MKVRPAVAIAVAVAATMILPVKSLAASDPVIEDGIVVRSFDGTPIVATLMLPPGASAARPVPAVLFAPGISEARQRKPTRIGVDSPALPGFFGPVMTVDRLLRAGYAVLTWDKRGYGESGGQDELQKPGVEDRDVSALIDHLATDARIAQQAPGDPRVGLSGYSYGAVGLLIAAAADRRVDALAPEFAWHNLADALAPDGVVRTAWASFQYLASLSSLTGAFSFDDPLSLVRGVLPTNPAGPQLGSVNPMVHRIALEVALTGRLSEQSREFLAGRGPDVVLGRVQSPTLLVGATTDTFATPSQVAANFASLAAAHPDVPLKMMWSCHWHGSCTPFRTGPPSHVADRIVAWFDRYVKGAAGVDTGARFEYLTDDGVWQRASGYPVAPVATLAGHGSGTMVVNGEPTIGGFLFSLPTLTSLRVPIAGGRGTVLGPPVVRFSARGTGGGIGDPQRAPIFFQVVNMTKGQVLGNQVTPKLVATDGLEHDYELSLEPLAYNVGPEDRLALEVVGSSVPFGPYRGLALIDLARIDVTLPLVR